MLLELMQRHANRATATGLQCRAEIVRGSVNKAKRTVTLALSSEYPVDRGPYIEVLDHSDGSVDLSRLRNAHPLLLNHDTEKQIGVVETAWLGPDRVCRCVVRLGNSDLADEVFTDIQDGIRPHISVGYDHIKEISAEFDKSLGKEVVRFAWMPYEVSSVSIPADPTVGVGRARPTVTAGISSTDFYRELETLKRGKYMRPNTNQQPAKPRLFGLSEVDAQEFSIVRGIRDILQTGQVQGFEREMLEEGRRIFPGQIQGGLFIPPDIVVGVNRRDPLFRDLNVTTATQGGNFVQTTVMTPIIEILRNKMVTQRAGIQILGGLHGNISIPRQTGAATAYSLAEQAQLTKSTQVINQVNMNPHRVGAWTAYSKQLLLQSSVDVEDFLRNDLMKVLAIKIDYQVLQGPGGADPLGIKSTTGIAAVTFGGTPTFAKMVEFETDLALANADIGRMAYITSPDVRAKLKTTPKLAASTFPIYIWEPAPVQFPEAEGQINAYRSFSTNQIDASEVAFGNFEDAILGMWGGMDCIIDPFTKAQEATVNVTINAFVDTAVRHAASFAWSTDSGVQ